MADQSQIVAEYLAGLSYKQVAAKLGIGKKRVELAVVAAGVARPKSGAETVIDWERAVTMRKAGYGAKAIAKACGGAFPTIREGLIKRGVWGDGGDWGNKTGKASNALGPWAGYVDAEIVTFAALERQHGRWWGRQAKPTKQEEAAAARAAYYANHEENKRRAALRAKVYYHTKWRHDPQQRCLRSLRQNVSRIARKIRCSRRTLRKENLLGCSYDEARAHIERQFQPGWTWLNHGKLWEIDHIRPLCSFDLTNPDQRRLAAHYTNLRPLAKAENRRLGVIARWSKRNAA